MLCSNNFSSSLPDMSRKKGTDRLPFRLIKADHSLNNCSLNIVFFFIALVFYLPGVFTVRTLTPRQSRERQESGTFKNLRKNTIFNEHPVCAKTLVSLLFIYFILPLYDIRDCSIILFYLVE